MYERTKRHVKIDCTKQIIMYNKKLRFTMNDLFIDELMNLNDDFELTYQHVNIKLSFKQKLKLMYHSMMLFVLTKMLKINDVEYVEKHLIVEIE